MVFDKLENTLRCMTESKYALFFLNVPRFRKLITFVGRSSGFCRFTRLLRVDLKMSMERWYNDPEWRKPKYWTRYLSRCQFVLYKFHMNWARIARQPQ
jgi:hypothetical protein